MLLLKTTCAHGLYGNTLLDIHVTHSTPVSRLTTTVCPTCLAVISQSRPKKPASVHRIQGHKVWQSPVLLQHSWRSKRRCWWATVLLIQL